MTTIYLVAGGVTTIIILALTFYYIYKEKQFKKNIIKKDNDREIDFATIEIGALLSLYQAVHITNYGKEVTIINKKDIK